MSAPPYVVTLGETLGLLTPRSTGSLTHVRELTLGVAGAESNVAIALRRLGTEATWCGRVGADPIGERVLRELRAEDVTVCAVVDPTAPTGLMLKERRTATSTRVHYHRAGSAGSRLEVDHVPRELVAEAAVLHLTGITAGLSESAAATVTRVVQIARDAGVRITFDVNHRAGVWSDRDPAAVYRGLASASDVLFAGEDEGRLLVPEAGSVRDLVERLAGLGPDQVVVKLGSEGCHALVDGVHHRVPAVPVTAVDTVGAGDGFVAGYLSELLAGGDVATRLRTAVRVGAFACVVDGDWEGYPRRHELGLLDRDDPVVR